MQHFYSLMTFLQSNSKQTWNRDHNIGLFVIFIGPAALMWMIFVSHICSTSFHICLYDLHLHLI